MTDDDRMMTAREICGLAGFSLMTLHRLIKAGRFPRPLVVGPQVRRWRTGEVKAWLERLTAARDGREAA